MIVFLRIRKPKLFAAYTRKFQVKSSLAVGVTEDIPFSSQSEKSQLTLVDDARKHPGRVLGLLP